MQAVFIYKYYTKKTVIINIISIIVNFILITNYIKFMSTKWGILPIITG